ncbi:MAG TPA: hypothetical protein VEB86_15860 [Chryseosolibacter sp.]|nr:hypothetical protein [Chryseosolibacter sp.]
MIRTGIVSLLFILTVGADCIGQDTLRPIAGTLDEITIEIQKRNSLAIIPVMINGKIRVNLILDPYCQSVILFGKRYARLLEKSKLALHGKSAKVRVGTRGPALSLSNYVSVGPVLGENLPILVVPNSDALNFFTSVHGVIGTEFFRNYDIEINRRLETMTIKRSQGEAFTQKIVQRPYPFQ